MAYCNKCGQPVDHPPGTCPYDDEVSRDFSRENLFTREIIHKEIPKYNFAYVSYRTNDNLDL